jgi:hypothetical protein
LRNCSRSHLATESRSGWRGVEGNEGNGDILLFIENQNVPFSCPGLYVTDDPGSKDAAARKGALSIRLGLGWAKSHSFHTGQTPVLKYNRQLMMAILHDKIRIAKAVNVTVITLDEAPRGYADFDQGVARKFVIDPHGSVKNVDSMRQTRTRSHVAEAALA